MTIDLAVAEKIPNMTVFGFGFGLVFIGLICIIALCSLLGFACKKSGNNKSSDTVSCAKVISSGNTSLNIPNRGEFIAAVSAVMAETLGTSITGIRILSVKKL